MRKQVIENKIYAAIIGHCEEMEAKKQYRGNGHHLAQRLTALVAPVILSKGQMKVYAAMTNLPTKTQEIALKCNLPSKQVAATLLQIESKTLLVLRNRKGKLSYWYKSYSQ